jgi:hypothetical protein
MIREAPDGGEATIAGCGSIAALGFDVLEEREDGVGAQVVEP